MTERLRRLAPPDLTAAQAELYEAIAGGPRAQGRQFFELKDTNGGLNGPFGVMLHVPGLGMPLQDLGAAIRYRTSLSDRVREIAILIVAVETRCDFEWHAHAPIGKHAGLTDDELADLRRGVFAGSDRIEAAVVDLSQVVLTGVDPDDERYAVWRDVLGETGLLELVVLVGYYRTLADLMRVAGVGADGVAL